MEKILFIAAIVSLTLSIIVFVGGIFNYGTKDYLKTKTAKISLMIFMIYAATFAGFLYVSN
jgi:hypothetical protein